MKAACWALLLAGCSVYAPVIEDCAIRCPTGECPEGLFCSGFFCTGGTVCECQTGETRECQLPGCSRPGVQACTHGVWGRCVVDPAPTAEVCNGLDDDCDGVVDDVAQAPLCPLQEGVCTGATQVCTAGRFELCDATRYGPHFEFVETSCDERDNDCDGLVDRSAPVPVTEARAGRFWLFEDGEQLVVVVNVDGGVERSSWGPTLALLARERVEGVAALDAAPHRWLSAGALHLDDGGTLTLEPGAAALSDRAVVFRDDDGGLRYRDAAGTELALGADDGGTLRFSEHGLGLVFPSGVVLGERVVRDAPVAPLRALVESAGHLIGLPVEQPAAKVVLLAPLEQAALVTLWFGPEALEPLALVPGASPQVLARLQSGGAVVSATGLSRAPWLQLTDETQAVAVGGQLVVASATAGRLELLRFCPP